MNKKIIFLDFLEFERRAGVGLAARRLRHGGADELRHLSPVVSGGDHALIFCYAETISSNYFTPNILSKQFHQNVLTKTLFY
jgi:hypothetical protein